MTPNQTLTIGPIGDLDDATLRFIWDGRWFAGARKDEAREELYKRGQAVTDRDRDGWEFSDREEGR